MSRVAGRGEVGSALRGIDPTLWPDVATVPNSPVRAAIAKRLFQHAVARLPLQVHALPARDGEPTVVYGGGDAVAPVMLLRRPRSFFQRVGATGTIGFGEAFMAGDWDAEDPAAVLGAFAAQLGDLVPRPLQRLRSLVLSREPSADENTVEGARRNISRHYDLSNELFREFLDQTMTYSAAIFAGDPGVSGDDLTTAQHRKIDRLLDAAGVRSGSRVLEIGTGWGELALRAAERGADVTSITISAEQAALARQRISAAGVEDRARVLLQDYRNTQGRYDAVVSVEMIEAVGARYWDEYFATVDRLLVPGGRFGLQAILQLRRPDAGQHQDLHLDA